MSPELAPSAPALVKLAEKALAAHPGKGEFLETLGAALYRAGKGEAAVR